MHLEDGAPAAGSSLFSRVTELVDRGREKARASLARQVQGVVQDEFFFIDENERRFPGRTRRYRLTAIPSDPFSRRWVSARFRDLQESEARSGAELVRQLRSRLVSRIAAPRVEPRVLKPARSAQPGIARFLQVGGALDGRPSRSMHGPQLPSERFRPRLKLWNEAPGTPGQPLTISRHPLYCTKTSHDPSRAGGCRSLLQR